MPVITTQKCHFQAPIQSETVYSCSYSKGGNEDLLDFLQKKIYNIDQTSSFSLASIHIKTRNF